MGCQRSQTLTPKLFQSTGRHVRYKFVHSHSRSAGQFRHIPATCLFSNLEWYKLPHGMDRHGTWKVRFVAWNYQHLGDLARDQNPLNTGLILQTDKIDDSDAELKSTWLWPIPIFYMHIYIYMIIHDSWIQWENNQHSTTRLFDWINQVWVHRKNCHCIKHQLLAQQHGHDKLLSIRSWV